MSQRGRSLPPAAVAAKCYGLQGRPGEGSDRGCLLMAHNPLGPCALPPTPPRALRCRSGHRTVASPRHTGGPRSQRRQRARGAPSMAGTPPASASRRKTATGRCQTRCNHLNPGASLRGQTAALGATPFPCHSVRWQKFMARADFGNVCRRPKPLRRMRSVPSGGQAAPLSTRFCRCDRRHACR